MTTAFCSVALLGMLGLVVDLGTIYVVKNELQVYADAAALAAAARINGTKSGLQEAARIGWTAPPPNRYRFGTSVAESSWVDFSKRPDSDWLPEFLIWSDDSARDYRFVRVQTSAKVPVYFLGLLVVFGGSSCSRPSTTVDTVKAVSVAGVEPASTLGNFIDPFSPDVLDVADPDYGFKRGGGDNLYTVVWSNKKHTYACNGTGGSGSKGCSPASWSSFTTSTINGQPASNTSNVCPGEYAFGVPSSSVKSDRGYIDLGQGNGASALADAILYHAYPTVPAIRIGSHLEVVNGNKGAQNANGTLQQRVGRDSDATSLTYSAYVAAGKGNGSRLLRVPVNDPRNDGEVLGFATFFLPPTPCLNDGRPCCAEFVGASALMVGNSLRSGPGSGRAYAVKLFGGG